VCERSGAGAQAPDTVAATANQPLGLPKLPLPYQTFDPKDAY
jgi:hypothetical protein